MMRHSTPSPLITCRERSSVGQGAPQGGHQGEGQANHTRNAMHSAFRGQGRVGQHRASPRLPWCAPNGDWCARASHNTAAETTTAPPGRPPLGARVTPRMPSDLGGSDGPSCCPHPPPRRPRNPSRRALPGSDRLRARTADAGGGGGGGGGRELARRERGRGREGTPPSRAGNGPRTLSSCARGGVAPPRTTRPIIPPHCNRHTTGLRRRTRAAHVAEEDTPKYHLAATATPPQRSKGRRRAGARRTLRRRKDAPYIALVCLRTMTTPCAESRRRVFVRGERRTARAVASKQASCRRRAGRVRKETERAVTMS